MLLSGGILGAIVIAAAVRIIPTRAAPILAVGAITEPQGFDTSAATQVLPDLITTALARAPGLRVISHTRLYEVLSDLGVHSTASSALALAARQAGAQRLLEGVLHRGGGDSLLLDLQVVDLATGRVRRGYAIAAPDVFMLADRSAATVADGFGRPLSDSARGGLASPSLAARRLYEEGLRAYYFGDVNGALRLFGSALAEDSTFALAAYRLGLLEVYGASTQADSGLRLLRSAARLSRRAPDEERLRIASAWLVFSNDPRAIATAETLTVRFADAAVGPIALGTALVHGGEFMAAVQPLRQTIEQDSLSLAGHGPHCRACDAFGALVSAYLAADSLAAAERTAREWLRRQPDSPWPWRTLADVVSRTGRYADALDALGHARRMEPGAHDPIISEAEVAIRADSVALAERLLREELRGAIDPSAAFDLLWRLGIVLRTEGRLNDAFMLARETAYGHYPAARHEQLRPSAIVLRELGQPVLAAALYDSMARDAASADSIAPSLGARNRAFGFALEGEALGAAGDTAAVARLADQVERYGYQSGYARDQRLHWHLRGLLAEARGRPDSAEVYFTRAVYSPTSGFSRTNVELARLYLASGRPGAAVAVLRPVLHGSSESGNSYYTRTAIHELLAQAFDSAGQRDSAIVHYGTVARVWSAGDPAFQLKARTARARALTLADRSARAASH